MLHFIDISSWQEGLDINALSGVDAVVIKATGGVGYVNPFCDAWVQQCIQRGMLWGFYHFAREDGCASSAHDEAAYFVDNCAGYFGHGIPVLDWERDSATVEWVNEFVQTVHQLTGVWPWIYANPRRFTNGVEQNCGRWVAAYPTWILHPHVPFDPGDAPEVPGLVCAWQYASDGRADGYWADLDVNVFFGDSAAWLAYAGASAQAAPEQPASAPKTPENAAPGGKYTITGTVTLEPAE